MSVTDHDRRALFHRLEAVLGADEAAVLMEPAGARALTPAGAVL